MTAQQFSENQIDSIARQLAQYIGIRRHNFYSAGDPLTAAQLAAMSRSFSGQLLDRVRLAVQPGFRFEDPALSRLFTQLRLSRRPDFSRITAITFQDVIVSCEPLKDSLLFHELVHAEQYLQLGVDRFAGLYVRGLLSSEGYKTIPLEVNAYQLEARFVSSPETGVAVAEEVAAWIREDRFLPPV
jgi:hypothetical protein